MENENKCFFSISLENGITITGKNPVHVKEFLADLSLICMDAKKSEINRTHKNWCNYISSLEIEFDNAWGIIYDNIINEE